MLCAVKDVLAQKLIELRAFLIRSIAFREKITIKFNRRYTCAIREAENLWTETFGDQ